MGRACSMPEIRNVKKILAKKTIREERFQRPSLMTGI
jgi:hypothetical protein